MVFAPLQRGIVQVVQSCSLAVVLSKLQNRKTAKPAELPSRLHTASRTPHAVSYYSPHFFDN